MKKKNSKDNLEDLFRNLLRDSKKIHQAQGWNVPPDNLWNNIQEELSKEKKEEKKFLYWHWLATAASILLLLSIFQLYQSNQQIQHLSKKLIENDQVVQKIQHELQALNEKKEEKIQPVDSQNVQFNDTEYHQAILNSSTYTDKKRISKGATVFNNINVTKNAIISKSATPSSPNKKLGGDTFEMGVALVSTKKENSSQHKDVDVSFPEKEKTLNTISILENLSTPTPQLKLKNRTNNWTNAMITPIIKKSPKFYVSVDYAPVLTNVKEKVSELDKYEFSPRREKQETAFTTGLHFGVKWNKGWSLETGLRFLSIKKLVQHNRIIPYDFLQERLNGNGDYESNLNLQLTSSEGVVDTDISLARSSVSTVASDANINMDITFTTERNYLEVPLIVKKEWAIGSFALSLKAGLLNRFLLTKNFELQQVTIDDTRFNSTTNHFRERTNSKSKNYTAHYLAGLGLEYTFRPKLSFYAEPTFIRSMQPVIGFRKVSNYKKSKILNVGLRYIL